MPCKTKIIDLLVERRITDGDAQHRNRELKARLDKLGKMLNATKAAWNKVYPAREAQIMETDYEVKGFE